jgi:hypothetical protein
VWRKLEGFFFEGRWRRDEYAWTIWRSVLEYRPQVTPDHWHRGLISGRVVRTYQRARRGSKVVVDFGPPVGVQDTWWPRMAPPRGRFVFVEAHFWPGGGTHSGGPVIWIDRWDSTAPGDVLKRARRHERRLTKLAAGAGAAGA